MPARQCAEMAKALKLVEGGMKPKDAAKEAGANVFVAGSYVFNGDVNERVQTLRAAIQD